jgi:hypothetical protein
MTDCRERRRVDEHFAGTIAVTDERRMRHHLLDCPDCRAHYERHLRLCAVDPGAPSARERLGRGLGLAPRRRSVTSVVGPVLALGVVSLVLVMRPSTPPSSRGRAPGSQLIVYEMPRGGMPQQAVGRVARDSGLAFAYANLAHRRRLSVFGLDDQGRIYWYHPAWTAEGEDPVGVPVVADERIHEIPQVIHQPVAGPRLQVFALFADRPIGVREVEAALAHAPRDGQGRAQLSLPGTEVSRLELALEDRR